MSKINMFVATLFGSILLCSCATMNFEKTDVSENTNRLFERMNAEYKFSVVSNMDNGSIKADRIKFNSLYRKMLEKYGGFKTISRSENLVGISELKFDFSTSINTEIGGSFHKLTAQALAGPGYVILASSAGLIPLISSRQKCQTIVRVFHDTQLVANLNFEDEVITWTGLIPGIAGAVRYFSMGSPTERYVESVVKRTLALLNDTQFLDLPEPEPEPILEKPLPTVDKSMIAAVSTSLPKTRKKNQDAVAVIIGIQRYQKSGVPEVRYAVSDGRLVRKYLLESFGFQEHNIITLENPTLADLVITFGNDKSVDGRLASYVKSDVSDIFVYYSGHGAPNLKDQAPYLVPSDADPDRITLSGYPVAQLYANLSQLKAKSVTVVLDACFSGASGEGTSIIQNASPAGIQVNAPSPLFANGVVISASTGSQLACWYNEAGHGLLTYYYLKGLQGNADLNKDNKITLQEMRTYLQDRQDGVPYIAGRLYGREQVPQVWGNDEAVIFQK